MNNASQLPWLIVTGSISLVGALIVIYLRSIKANIQSFRNETASRIDNHQAKIETLEQQFAQCRLASTEKFVTAESFIKDVGYTRKQLDTLNTSVQQLIGKFDSVKQMPEVAAAIAETIVDKLNRRGT